MTAAVFTVAVVLFVFFGVRKLIRDKREFDANMEAARKSHEEYLATMERIFRR